MIKLIFREESEIVKALLILLIELFKYFLEVTLIIIIILVMKSIL